METNSTLSGASAPVSEAKQQPGDNFPVRQLICGVVGIDLGDKQSKYRVLDLQGNLIGDGVVANDSGRHCICCSMASDGCGSPWKWAHILSVAVVC